VDRGTGHGRRAIGHLGAETEPNRNRNEIETETAPAVGSRTAFFNPSPAFAGFEVDPRAYGLGMSPRPAHRSLAVGLAVAALAGCPKRYETDLRTPEQRGQLDRESKYLKVHMRDGRLYVLTDWTVFEVAGEVVGAGDAYDDARNKIGEGEHRVPIAGVALFETNVPKVHGSIVAMTIVTGLSVAVTVACLANPKACFGSCPTIYAETADGTRLVAEAFSSSIAPSLEATDIDALYLARVDGRELELTVTNEAYETHVIRRFDVLAAPRPPGGRVFADATDPGTLWAASPPRPPRACAAAEGDCLSRIAAFDDDMRASVTDGIDLASRESVEIDIGPGTGARRGLVIGARHTFLTTYLFYQALAWLGDDAGATLAALERGDESTREDVRRIVDLLGAIDVRVEIDGRWQTAGSFQETGPLATDVAVVPLPPGAGRRIKLEMTRGNWRLDWIGVTELAGRVEPIRVEPLGAGNAALRDPERAVVHMPGDRRRLRYRLPAGDWELFLDSRGYYLEWMRDEWVAEQSKVSAALLFHKPDWVLRMLAPAFKEVESRMEEMFWNSRFRPWAGDGGGLP
jgi:hypothetical protein